MNEDKGARYQRLRARATVMMGAVASLLLAALAFTPGAVLLRDGAAWLTGSDPVSQGPLSWAAMALGTFLVLELVTLPVRFHRDHVLERRYRLSTRTPDSWFESHAASAAGMAILGVAAAVVTFAVMHWLPETWWLAVALLWTTVAFLLSWLAPSLLFPLFWAATPLAANAPTLAGRLQQLSTRAGVPLLDVRAWHLGRHTGRANAALVGLGRTQRVLLSDTLLETYTPEEIEVILAHELGHHRHHDLWVDLACEGLVTAGALGLASAVMQAAWPRLGLLGPTDVAGLPVILLTVGAVALMTAPARQALARAHERRADEFALRLTGNPAAMVSSLRRLGVQNLADVTPVALSRSLFASHPSVAERIARAQAWSGQRSLNG